MAIRAVVFDIGGVLEVTSDLGVAQRWERQLGLRTGEFNERLSDVWMGGGIGALTEDEMHRAIGERLGHRRARRQP